MTSSRGIVPVGAAISMANALLAPENREVVTQLAAALGRLSEQPDKRATLREFLASPDGDEFYGLLIKSGILSATEVAAWRADGKFLPEAKIALERAIAATALGGSARAYEALSHELRTKLEKSWPAIFAARILGGPEWDLSQVIYAATELIKRGGGDQVSITGPESEFVSQFANLLQNNNSADLRAMFRRWLQSSQANQDATQAGMGLDDIEGTPAENAFNAIFGFPMGEITTPAVFDVDERDKPKPVEPEAEPEAEPEPEAEVQPRSVKHPRKPLSTEEMGITPEKLKATPMPAELREAPILVDSPEELPSSEYIARLKEVGIWNEHLVEREIEEGTFDPDNKPQTVTYELEFESNIDRALVGAAVGDQSLRVPYTKWLLNVGMKQDVLDRLVPQMPPTLDRLARTAGEQLWEGPQLMVNRLTTPMDGENATTPSKPKGKPKKKQPKDEAAPKADVGHPVVERVPVLAGQPKGILDLLGRLFEVMPPDFQLGEKLVLASELTDNLEDAPDAATEDFALLLDPDQPLGARLEWLEELVGHYEHNQDVVEEPEPEPEPDNNDTDDFEDFREGGGGPTDFQLGSITDAVERTRISAPAPAPKPKAKPKKKSEVEAEPEPKAKPEPKSKKKPPKEPAKTKDEGKVRATGSAPGPPPG